MHYTVTTHCFHGTHLYWHHSATLLGFELAPYLDEHEDEALVDSFCHNQKTCGTERVNIQIRTLVYNPLLS